MENFNFGSDVKSVNSIESKSINNENGTHIVEGFINEEIKETSVEDMNMMISPICNKDGKKYAFVSFSWNGKEAEGRIPECEIVRNTGFTDEQLKLIVEYMKDNLDDLKSRSAGINIFENFYGIS